MTLKRIQICNYCFLRTWTYVVYMYCSIVHFFQSLGWCLAISLNIVGNLFKIFCYLPISHLICLFEPCFIGLSSIHFQINIIFKGAIKVWRLTHNVIDKFIFYFSKKHLINSEWQILGFNIFQLQCFLSNFCMFLFHWNPHKCS